MSGKPILRQFPSQFETERLLLRAPMPDDGKALRQLVLASQEYLKPWMPWAVNVPDEEGYEAHVRQSHIRFLAREELQFLLFLKESGQMIGSSGFHVKDWAVPRLEIGYWLAPEHTGQGYMTEAVYGLEQFARQELGVRRLEIYTDANNVASAAVAKRCEYLLEATLHNHSRHHLTNEMRTTLIFGKVFEA